MNVPKLSIKALRTDMKHKTNADYRGKSTSSESEMILPRAKNKRAERTNKTELVPVKTRLGPLKIKWPVDLLSGGMNAAFGNSTNFEDNKSNKSEF